ncbi:XdhC family protein [Bacillus sp. JJ1562]|uniref:XdhC family protein n=1 Tax=Bacillus sp. JJ1562 TaxID=3122960 RepID=UPI003001731B
MIYTKIINIEGDYMSLASEFIDLLTKAEYFWDKGDSVALLILCEKKGSTYRKTGAKMIVSSSRESYGFISGGCLENSLLEISNEVINKRGPKIIEIDSNDDSPWGLQLGCGGSVKIAIIPMLNENEIWRKVINLIKSQDTFYIGFDLTKGNHIITDKSNKLFHNKTGLTTYNKQTYFVEKIEPIEKLFIAGANDDVIPIVELAKKIGFFVAIIDPREHFNNKSRFPFADKHIYSLDEIEDGFLNHGWWLIMNHNLERDRISLMKAVKVNSKFIGILGSNKRIDTLLSDFKEKPKNLYAPVGLNLAGDTVYEVAISIISQLIMLKNGGTEESLNGKEKVHG